MDPPAITAQQFAELNTINPQMTNLVTFWIYTSKHIQLSDASSEQLQSEYTHLINKHLSQLHNQDDDYFSSSKGKMMDKECEFVDALSAFQDA